MKNKILMLMAVLLVTAGVCLFPGCRGSDDPLESFYKITQYDPLFYCPLLTPADMDFTQYGDYEDILLSKTMLFQKYAARKKPLNLIPRRFLSSLAGCIPLTESFLAAPTRSKALQLIKAYRATVGSYMTDIVALGEILDAAITETVPVN